MKLSWFLLLTWNTAFPQRNLIVKVGQFSLSGSRRLLEALLNNTKKLLQLYKQMIMLIHIYLLIKMLTKSHRTLSELWEFEYQIKHFFKAFHKWSNTSSTSTVFTGNKSLRSEHCGLETGLCLSVLAVIKIQNQIQAFPRALSHLYCSLGAGRLPRCHVF